MELNSNCIISGMREYTQRALDANTKVAEEVPI